MMRSQGLPYMMRHNSPLFIPQQDFTQIEAALGQLASFMKSEGQYTKSTLDTIFPVLEFTKAKQLAQALSHENTISQSEVLAPLALDSSHIDGIRAVLRWNVPTTYSNTLDYTEFYDHASFVFDGQYIKAQYFYDNFGLGIVLQLGGPVVGPFKAAMGKQEVNTGFCFAGPKTWRLLYMFGADTAADGPEWTGYPTINEARAEYKKEQEARSINDLSCLRNSIGIEPPSPTLHSIDVDDDDTVQLSPSEASFDML